jgi:hypothetical protein
LGMWVRAVGGNMDLAAVLNGALADGELADKEIMNIHLGQYGVEGRVLLTIYYRAVATGEPSWGLGRELQAKVSGLWFIEQILQSIPDAEIVDVRVWSIPNGIYGITVYRPIPTGGPSLGLGRQIKSTTATQSTYEAAVLLIKDYLDTYVGDKRAILVQMEANRDGAGAVGIIVYRA